MTRCRVSWRSSSEEAALHGAVLFIDDYDDLLAHMNAELRHTLAEQIAQRMDLTILAGAQPWTPLGGPPLGVLVVPHPLPGFGRRRMIWETCLAASGVQVDPRDLNALSHRFHMSHEQIDDTVQMACRSARLRATAGHSDGADGKESPAPTAAELFATACANIGHELERLARRVTPIHSWDDIVLPPNSIAQLHELCQRVRHRHIVMEQWGFDQKLSMGKGVTALFAGPPGTGKTMAAEVVASELGLEVYTVDLPSVIDKYVGEPRKIWNESSQQPRTLMRSCSSTRRTRCSGNAPKCAIRTIDTRTLNRLSSAAYGAIRRPCCASYERA